MLALAMLAASAPSAAYGLDVATFVASPWSAWIAFALATVVVIVLLLWAAIDERSHDERKADRSPEARRPPPLKPSRPGQRGQHHRSNLA